MILSILFFGFILYLAYKLVFNFIIPVYKTTREIKRKFRQMGEQMQQQTHPTQGQGQQPSAAGNNKKTGVGEYIDYEEVR